MFKIGYFQFRPDFGEVEKNLERIFFALTGVQANLIVLPELSLTGYYFKDREELSGLAEDVNDSSTIERLKTFCQQQDMHIVTGFAEKTGDKIFNSAILVGPGKIIQVYRKLHLFNTEKDYFDPGDMPLEVALVGDVRIGMMVCFDWVFPEVARILGFKGRGYNMPPGESGTDLLPAGDAHPVPRKFGVYRNRQSTWDRETAAWGVDVYRTEPDNRSHRKLAVK